MAIGCTFDNCVDLYANDLGLIAVTEGDKIVGYNVLVGGGMGVTPSAKKTFPAVAKRLCFVTPDKRAEGRRGRLQGAARLRQSRRPQSRPPEIPDRQLGHRRIQSEGRGVLRRPAAPSPHPDDVHGFNDHMGWDEQGDGRWFYGLNIENGRIKDTPEMRLKTAIREICRTLKPAIRLTPHQSIIFSDIRAAETAIAARKHSALARRAS